jgi:tRNA G18 (ribose-2'-O)-methylase SpoU
MNIIPIHRVDDPRIALFRNVRDSEMLDQWGLFVAEGEHLVRRVLDSRFKVQSVLIEEAYQEKLLPLLPADTPVYMVDKKLIREIARFDFNRGALALVVRQPLPSPTQLPIFQKKQLALVICPEINDAENLGVILRTAAAFNVDAVILGERCRDPFYRRTIRVSMGAVFTLPLAQSDHLLDDLHLLRDRYEISMIATVLHDATGSLPAYSPPDRFALLFGTESQGLGAEWLACCDERLTLPMPNHTDSLNVSVAAGIFLYHCMQTQVHGHS